MAAKQVQADLIDKLGIASANRQHALEEYGRLFQKPLSASHLAALAALFGWELPASVETSQDVAVYIGPAPVEEN